MGASREMAIASLVEPALLAAIFALAIPAGTTDPGRPGRRRAGRWLGGARVRRACWPWRALLVVAIAETGRIPVDNPDTHLELTMVHEGMLLEYAGPQLAILQLAALRETGAGARTDGGAGAALGPGPALPLALAALVFKWAALGALLATVESVYVKLRILRLPDLLATAFALGGLSLVARGVFGA